MAPATTGTTGNGSPRAPAGPAAAALDAAARAALHAANGDVARALPLFVRQLEQDPELLIVLLGRRAVELAARGCLIRTGHSVDGARLVKARKEWDEHRPTDETKAQRERVASAIARSPLYTVLVGGVALYNTTRAEVEREQATTARTSRFLALVLETLPPDPDAVVGSHLALNKADELWKRSEAPPS